LHARQIGFVLHNLVKMIAVFSVSTTDSTDSPGEISAALISRGERGLGERVYAISHLPIFLSTHKPLAYLFGTYYTQKRQNFQVKYQEDGAAIISNQPLADFCVLQ